MQPRHVAGFVLIAHCALAGVVLTCEVARAATSAPVAALPVVASGLAADEIEAVDTTVARAVAGHFGARAIAKKAVDERLDKAGAKGMRCDRTDPTCSAQIGALCGAGVVIVGTFVVDQTGATLALRMVDVVEAAQLAYAARPVSAELTVDEVREALAALNAPAARAASVDVRGEPGARVLVDDVERATLPLNEPLVVTPGPHVITVASTIPFTARIDLRRGEPVVLDAPWEPAPPPTPVAKAPAAPPPEGSPLPLGLVVGGVAGVVAGGVVVGIGLAPLLAAHGHRDTLAQREDAARADQAVLVDDKALIEGEQAQLQESLDAWRSYGLGLVVAGGVVAGAAVAVAGAGVVLWGE